MHKAFIKESLTS